MLALGLEGGIGLRGLHSERVLAVAAPGTFPSRSYVDVHTLALALGLALALALMRVCVMALAFAAVVVVVGELHVVGIVGVSMAPPRYVSVCRRILASGDGIESPCVVRRDGELPLGNLLPAAVGMIVDVYTDIEFRVGEIGRVDVPLFGEWLFVGDGGATASDIDLRLSLAIIAGERRRCCGEVGM